MTIEKLKNGRYRVRQQIDGHRYTKTLDHKPTQKEALRIIAELTQTPYFAPIGSVGSYIDKYITDCEKRLKSPTTTRNYRSILRNLPGDLLTRDLASIDQSFVQQMIDIYAETHSPKSVRNANGLLMAVIRRYKPDLILTINLPPERKKPVYEPKTSDVMRILDYSEGTRYECALKLACLGLRRSEIIAITADDLNGSILTISKAKVLNDQNEYVLKSTKTDATVRRILIPDALAELIRKQGSVFTGNPHTINEYLHKCQDNLNIPHFNLHYLRHFAAAFLHKSGYTDEQIIAYMGYSTSDCMRRVYRYNLDPEEAQKL